MRVIKILRARRSLYRLLRMAHINGDLLDSSITTHTQVTFSIYLKCVYTPTIFDEAGVARGVTPQPIYAATYGLASGLAYDKAPRSRSSNRTDRGLLLVKVSYSKWVVARRHASCT